MGVRPAQQLVVLAEGARGDEIEWGYIRRQIIHAAAKHRHMVEFDGPDYLRKERRLLGVGFDQGKIQFGGRHANWQTWEPGTRTNVGQPAGNYWNRGNGEHGFTEVEFHDFLWICYGCQRDLPVPLQEKGHISADLLTHWWCASYAVWFQVPGDLVVG